MSSLAEKHALERAIIDKLEPSDEDPHSNICGVLLSDEIEFYVNNFKLITHFNRTNLKPAAYELTVGDEYFISGEFLTLDSTGNENSKIIIPPFEVAVLKTTEILCLPRYLIGRWNIRVKHAYSGLLWVGGPQVDPGYVGFLFCPIYNLSDKPVTLNIGEPIAVIDFVKTTRYNKGISQEYPKAKRKFLQEYGIDSLQSALYTKAGAKLSEFEENINNIDQRFNTFTQISLAIFAIIFGLVATISKVSSDNITLGASIYGALTLAISISAIMISIFSSIYKRLDRLVDDRFGRITGMKARDVRAYFRRSWWFGVLTSISVAMLIGLFLSYLVAPFFQEARQTQVLTKVDLDNLRDTMSTEIRKLSKRLDQPGPNRPASTEDLEKLKAMLEQHIEAIKTDTRKTDH